MNSMKKKYERDAPDIYAEWLAFAELVPRSDDVQSYVNGHELHVPFRDILFPRNVIDNTSVLPPRPIHRLQDRAPTVVIIKLQNNQIYNHFFFSDSLLY